MPDTGAARAAIRNAREQHRKVMGGISMAELKLQAAGGLIHDDPLPYAEDSPVWLAHAQDGLAVALESCDELRAAIQSAQAEVTKLARQVPVAADSPLRCHVPMIHADKSEERCVLAVDHLQDDIDHRDHHGCRAPVLVSQSTIEHVRRIAEEFPDG